jgi:hypothetical protein
MLMPTPFLRVKQQGLIGLIDLVGQQIKAGVIGVVD